MTYHSPVITRPDRRPASPADLRPAAAILPTFGSASPGEPLTMSSREIAELLGNRHDDVKRSIERLVMKAVFDRPPSAEHQIETSHGRRHTAHVYLLDKRSSLIVVAQLSPEFTARHDNVKRTIDRLANRSAISHPPMGDRPFVDAIGQKRTEKVYLLDKRSSLTGGGEPLTMSSLEIAELTGKRHDHVLADIRKMLAELGKTSPEFSGDVPDSYGRPRFVFNLPKRETMILVSGYSITLRARIVDRWQELEEKVANPPAPQFAIPQGLGQGLRRLAGRSSCPCLGAGGALGSRGRGCRGRFVVAGEASNLVGLYAVNGSVRRCRWCGACGDPWQP